MNKLPKVFTPILVVVAFLILTTPAFAFEIPNPFKLGTNGSNEDNNQTSQSIQKTGDDNKSEQEIEKEKEVENEQEDDASGTAKLKPSTAAKLQDTKLKECQAKESAIKQRAASLTGTVNNMLLKFDAIAQRVEEYYTAKVVSSGKTVSNYDSLVADIQSKKSAVEASLSTAQSLSANFSCTSADPKGQTTQYRQDMQQAQSALKNYRTSIKNLIVAVSSVVGEANSTESSGSSR